MTRLITGANRGIGYELVRQSLTAGEQVIAACRRPDAAKSLQALAEDHDSLTILSLDVLESESREAFFFGCGGASHR